MSQEPPSAPLSRILHPVLTEAGYRMVGRVDRKTRFPTKWRKESADGVMLEVRLDRGRKGVNSYYVDLDVYIMIRETGKRARSPKAAILGRVESLLPSGTSKPYLDALDIEKPLAPDQRERLIVDALSRYGLPALESVFTREAVIECYRRESGFGTLQPEARPYLGIPKVRAPIPQFDLPVVGNDKTRLTDEDLRQGDVSLLVVWSIESPGSEQGHEALKKLCRRLGISRVYGIHIGADTRAAQLAAFLLRHGNPYTVCGMDPTGLGARDVQMNRQVNWNIYFSELPLITFVDGEGLETGFHSGPLITEFEMETEIPAMIEEARTFYDWPVPGREETQDRGRKTGEDQT